MNKTSFSGEEAANILMNGDEFDELFLNDIASKLGIPITENTPTPKAAQHSNQQEHLLNENKENDIILLLPYQRLLNNSYFFT